MKRMLPPLLVMTAACADNSVGGDQPAPIGTLQATVTRPPEAPALDHASSPPPAASAACPEEGYRWGTVSPSGHYALEIEDLGKGSVRIVVFETVTGTVVSRIDPNPGGGVNGALNARFTANDNVLASWGCGTYCGVAALFTPRGKDLRANLEFYKVAPSGVFAVDYPAWSSPLDGTIELVDLRTGRSVQSEHHVGVPPVCCVTWALHRAELHPCDSKEPVVTVEIPESLPVLEPAG